MKKLLLQCLLCALMPIISLTQTLPLKVVSTSGGSTQALAGSLDWSVGEIVVAPHIANNIYLGEGFQQVWVTTISTDDPTGKSATKWRVYPNPAKEFLFIETDIRLHIQVYDLLGRMVGDVHTIHQFGEIPLQGLAAGLYMLHVFDDAGLTIGAAKLLHTL